MIISVNDDRYAASLDYHIHSVGRVVGWAWFIRYVTEENSMLVVNTASLDLVVSVRPSEG